MFGHKMLTSTAALVEAVDKGQLDLALAVGHADRPTAEVLGELELVWIAGRAFARRTDQPLPLVVLGPQCAFRKEAIDKLDRSNVSWRIAAVSPSLAGLWASAIGGLGITVRSALGVPGKLVWDKSMFDLPALPAFPVTLHARTGALSEGVERLRAITRDAVAAALTARRERMTRRAPIRLANA